MSKQILKSGTSIGANVKEAYKLVDEDSAKAGEYIKIYKDSALQSVVLNENQELVFTYLLADGSESVVPVSVASFLAESDGTSVLRTQKINPGKKLLYTGTVTKGNSFTVPNTAYYDLFAIALGTTTSTYTFRVLAYKSGSTIQGVCGRTDGTYNYLHFVSVTYNGDRWTLDGANTQYAKTDGTLSPLEDLCVKQVIGII